MVTVTLSQAELRTYPNSISGSSSSSQDDLSYSLPIQAYWFQSQNQIKEEHDDCEQQGWGFSLNVFKIPESEADTWMQRWKETVVQKHQAEISILIAPESVGESVMNPDHEIKWKSWSLQYFISLALAINNLFAIKEPLVMCSTHAVTTHANWCAETKPSRNLQGWKREIKIIPSVLLKATWGWLSVCTGQNVGN